MSDPSAFLEALMDFGKSRTSKERDEWYSLQKILRQEWVESSLSDLEQEEPNDLMMHPLRLAL
ncbi:MAG: hypothetical protein ACPHKR_09265, partial [bacterium]